MLYLSKFVDEVREREQGMQDDDITDGHEVLYQRLLPPSGAELEEVKPPNNVLVSPIS